MKAFLTRKNIAVVLAAIVIASVAMVSAGTGGGGGFLTEWVSAAMRPLRSAAAAVARTFETIYGYMYEYEKVVAENDSLKKQIADFRQDYREYTEASEENARLRSLLGFAARHSDYTFETTTIIAWSASNWSSSFTLGKGSGNSDIAVGDAVITETGVLVGRVTEVRAAESTAVSVIDTTFSASVLIGEEGADGQASGDFTLMREGRLKLGLLEDGSTALAGDTVVTSGIGGVFPEGLVIGAVESIAKSPAGIGMYGVITPQAELGRATYVFVVTEFDANA
ncbi:MAG: rod shape-determining protein MreC [Oscillospiraceae bacterium]|jgi:rod shape-determining protein MreC|nr:rod shape-determining protein MreC [Oscillospiraceae bacterium]